MNKFYDYQNEVLELQDLETEEAQDYMEIGVRNSMPIKIAGNIVGNALVLSLVSI